MRADGEDLQALRRAIAELADAEAAEVVNEARMEARVKVRSILAEAMAERLLERAHADLGGGSRSQRPPAHPRPSGASSSTAPHPRGSASPAKADSEVAAPALKDPARAEPAPPSSAGATGPAASEDEAELGWYVYGVTRQDTEVEAMVGIDGVNRLALINGKDLAAIASQVPLDEFGEEALSERLEDLAWLEENARTHEHILDRVREQTALVPMRLCTIYRGEDSVRAMLMRERHFLLDALRRLSGRTEWGVKIFAQPGAPPGSGGEDATGGELAGKLAGAGPGESYMLGKRLEGMRDEELRRVAAQRCESAHARLSAVSVEARLNPLQPRELTDHEGAMLLNGVYLVDDSAADGFSAEVDLLREQERGHGLEVELTGPWPPYNFVNSSDEVGE